MDTLFESTQKAVLRCKTFQRELFLEKFGRDQLAPSLAIQLATYVTTFQQAISHKQTNAMNE